MQDREEMQSLTRDDDDDDGNIMSAEGTSSDAGNRGRRIACDASDPNHPLSPLSLRRSLLALAFLVSLCGECV